MKRSKFSGFSEVSVVDGGRKRLFLVCNTQITNHLGKKCRCNFRIRKDKVPKDDMEASSVINHKCSSSRIEDYLPPPKNEDLSIDEITKQLILFTAKSNLSLENATGPVMHNFLINLIKFSQSNPNKDPISLVPTTNRKAFTKMLINEGKGLYDKVLEEYISRGVAALSIDAGKISKTTYFNVIITNALFSIPPLLYKCVNRFRGDKLSYETNIKESISYLEEKGLVIAGIVADNLRVQFSAIEEVASELGNFFIVPCGCHTLALGINDAKIESDLFEKAFETIESFSYLTNNRDILSTLRISVPKRCSTRWTNLCDICLFTVNHYDHLIEYFNKESTFKLKSLKNSITLSTPVDMLSKYVAPMCILLLPLKILSEKLESDRMSIGFKYGFVKSALILIEQLSYKYHLERPAKVLIRCIDARINDTRSGLQDRVAFILTKQGRDIERMIRKGVPIDEIRCAFTEEFPIHIDDGVLGICEKIINDPPDFGPILSRIKEIEEIDHEDDSIAEATISQQSNSDSEPELEIEAVNSDSDEDKEEQYERTMDIVLDSESEEEISKVRAHNYHLEYSSLRELTFEDYGEFIMSHAPKFKFNGEKATRALTRWILHPESFTRNMEANITDRPYDTWRFLEQNDEFYDIAQFALKLLSIPTSEAACERMFWKLRKIMTDERNRTSDELCFAKIALQTLS